jgi:murein DD-endopeptidase MepM/ murein hydrolase activator NlpD
MTFVKIRRCGIARAGLVVILTGLVGACADQTEPAPVFQRGVLAAPVLGPIPTPPPAHQIVVQRGQSLGGLSHMYHVPQSDIIAANGLRPPYELKTGERLLMPSPGGSSYQPVGPIAAAPPVASATPLPPPRPESLTPPQTMTSSPPPTAQAQPDVIPLDGPAPKQPAATQAAPTPLTPPKSAATTLTPPPAAPADSGQPTVAGRFPWPVRGRVLASYGNTPGGGHNDGINIAAPRGTPVRAIDAGTVAYAGNEVKGYGNLLLIRHANGWISAYAHLEEVNVKPGDPITAGEVIAKVGDTGGVAEPQLHFELRRGKKPVDPREFLAPAPSAANPAGGRAG